MRVDVRKGQAVMALAGLAMILTGCDTFRSAAGLTKDAPDEFAVVTKQPLIIPPEFNLHPPRPGAAPVNQLSPTDTAQSALFPDDPATAANAITGNYSQGEKMLMANAGAANASDSIRQLIAADDKSMQAADESFTNSLLFGSSKGSDAPLDADAEKARLDGMKMSGTPVARMNQPVAQLPADNSGGASEPGTLPDLNGQTDTHPAHHSRRPAKKQKDSGGWFDDIF